MAPQFFQVDTKGICLMCISDCASETPVKSTGFKMFLRYLKIDIMDLGHFSSSLRPHLNGPDSVDVSVTLCQNCCSLTNQFLQLFQQFEKIRLELDNCAQNLNQEILEGGRDENRVREYRKRVRAPGTSHISPLTALNISIAERLREKTLEKCARRLALSTPKILTTKVILPQQFYACTPTPTIGRTIEKKSVGETQLDDDNEEKEESDNGSDDDTASLKPTEEAPQEESHSVFDKESRDELISQPPKTGMISQVEAKFGPYLPEKNGTCRRAGGRFLFEVMPCSSANPEVLKPLDTTVKLLPSYAQPRAAPILLDSSSHPELSQKKYTQVLDTLKSKDDSLDIDMTFEDGDGGEDIPTNDPLEIEEGPVMAEAASPSPAFKLIRLPHGKFKCSICSKILRTHDSIRQHHRDLHMTKKAFRCKHCHKTVGTRRALFTHIKLVHPFLKFRDRLPVGTTEIEFSQVTEGLVRHVKQDLAGFRETGGCGHYCTLCGKVLTFGTRSWREHIFRFHVDHIISKLERSKHNSNQNINVQSEDSSLNKNPLLQSSLIRKPEGSLDIGMTIEDGDNDNDTPTNDPLDLEEGPGPVMVQAASPPPAFKPKKLANGMFKCPICDKILSSYQTAWQHHRELHKAKKVFRCKHCHNTVGSRRALFTHIKLLHPFLKFGDRFPVGTTKIEFSQVTEGLVRTVKQDLVTYRENTGRVDHYCTLCGKVITFGTRSWRAHILSFHVDHIIAKLEKSKHRNRNINVQSEDCSLNKTPLLQSSLILKIEHEEVE